MAFDCGTLPVAMLVALFGFRAVKVFWGELPESVIAIV